jgi:hypothetical protein
MRFVRRHSTHGNWIWANKAWRACWPKYPTNPYVVKSGDKPGRDFSQALIDVMNAEFLDIERMKDSNRYVYFRVRQ